MARDFNAASDKLKRTSVPSTAINNFAMSAWIYLDAVASTQTAFINGYDGGSGTGWSLNISSGGFYRFTMCFVASVDSTATITPGVWTHILGERNAGTSRVYHDGIDDGATTASAPNTPASTLAIGMGQTNAGADTRPFDGKVCECAIWNRVLTSDEKTALSAGYSPEFYTESLMFYAPVKGANNPEDDRKSTTKLTVTGTTFYTHPDMIKYPNRPNTGINLRPRAFAPGIAR